MTTSSWIVPNPTTLRDLSLPTIICLVLHSLKSEKNGFIISHMMRCSKSISHSLEEEVDVTLNKKPKAGSAGPWKKS